MIVKGKFKNEMMARRKFFPGGSPLHYVEN